MVGVKSQFQNWGQDREEESGSWVKDTRILTTRCFHEGLLLESWLSSHLMSGRTAFVTIHDSVKIAWHSWRIYDMLESLV